MNQRIAVHPIGRKVAFVFQGGLLTTDEHGWTQIIFKVAPSAKALADEWIPIATNFAKDVSQGAVFM